MGGFPSSWSEWNGRYRDCVRDFWRSQPSTLPEFASRLLGSSDLYQVNGRRPVASVNFITAHDGFTMNDLVTYNNKHNMANGEDNRDGESNNRSWNCGVEGPTTISDVNNLRQRQLRNLFSTLLVSQGIPMIDPYNSAHRRYTYALVGNEHLRRIYSEVFGIEEEALLATGMPRLDHFLDEKVEKEYREEMADKFPWSAKGRVIVFAPTFRGTGQRTAYYPYDEIDMDRLYRMCVETDTYFVFEMHHFIRKRPDIPAEYADRIFDLSDESLTKLFFIADVLVTDYSSCFYDYLLLKKPVVFFVPDKTAYSLIRGVQRSIDEMAPGVVCDTFDEFLDVLRTRHYETVSPHPSSIDRAAERSGLASDRAIDTIIYGKDVPGVRKQASGKGGAVPVRQSDKSAKSERKAKELLDSKVADKDTKSASDEEE